LQSLQYIAWRARNKRLEKTSINIKDKQQNVQKVFTTTHNHAERLEDDTIMMTQKLYEYTGDSVHESTTDTVHAPKHYQGDECILAMEKMLGHDEFRGFLRGNIFKYMWRYKDKNGIEDLRKANWYLDRLIKTEGFK
jgi:hypothetical protein